MSGITQNHLGLWLKPRPDERCCESSRLILHGKFTIHRLKDPRLTNLIHVLSHEIAQSRGSVGGRLTVPANVSEQESRHPARRTGRKVVDVAPRIARTIRLVPDTAGDAGTVKC